MKIDEAIADGSSKQAKTIFGAVCDCDIFKNIVFHAIFKIDLLIA